MNAPPPRFPLSHDLIAAAFPGTIADDEAAQPELPPDAIDAMADQALRHLGPSDDVWLFAYGSLMWSPEPELDGAETRLATLRGWHRRFCLWQWRYRGSRDNPALVEEISKKILTKRGLVVEGYQTPATNGELEKPEPAATKRTRQAAAAE